MPTSKERSNAEAEGPCAASPAYEKGDVFVANLQPLKPGEEDLAFCCALPMGSKGLRG